MTRFLSALILLFVFTIPVAGEDLYLLKIENHDQLSKAREIVPHGYGVINDGFIVHLDQEQSDKLSHLGISLTLLVKDCQLDEYYLAMKDHSRETKAVLDLSPILSSAYIHLIRLDKGSGDILERDGYQLSLLGERKFPLFYNPPMKAIPGLLEYPEDTLAELVNYDSLYSYVTHLEDYYTRFTPTDSNHRARDWIWDKFRSFGYTDVDIQYFLAEREWMDVIDEPAWNVVCFKEGTEFPERLIVIGGHYDSYASNNYDYPAPGADDNASGTSAVLELARIFHDIDFKRSIMFVAFGAEEQGLDGAYHMSGEMVEDSVDIELMLNFDVIAYEANAVPDFRLTRVMNGQYVQVFADAAGRVNDLIPYIENGPLSSDDAAFYNNGFQSVALFEYTFHPDMHTPWDNSASIDFDYMRKIIQLGAVGIPIIDQSTDPTSFSVYDLGDGDGLRVVWDSCQVDYLYQIAYGYGLNSMYDTVEVPQGLCEYDLSGLTDGQMYYLTVIGTPLGGIGPLGYFVESATPLSIPLAPENLTAEPVFQAVSLAWDNNTEIDLDHYKLLRRPIGFDWQVLQDQVADINYIDYDVLPGQEYLYTLLAVDADLNESDSASLVSCFAATLDQGILLAEETQGGGINPLITQQNSFYNSIFDGYNFTRYTIDSVDEPLTRAVAGQYNPLFYIDDDDLMHHLEHSIDTIQWYTEFSTDIFIAGWETIYSVTGSSHFYAGNFFYDEMGLAFVARNVSPDFVGATGEGDWPDLILKPEAPYSGRLPDIQIFETANGGEVIARFNSFSNNPFYGNKPVGIAYDSYDGKTVILGCPLYWLTEESATALVNRTIQYFAEPSEYLDGDVNGDRIINLLDMTYIISYIYQNGAPPLRINDGDPNNDCTINILDIVYLIQYLYNSGPAPQEGCVE